MTVFQLLFHRWTFPSPIPILAIFIFRVMVDCVYNLQVCRLNLIKCVAYLFLYFIVPKDEQYSETDFLVLELFSLCAIFSLGDMVDFILD